MKKMILIIITLIGFVAGAVPGRAAGILTPAGSNLQPIRIQDHHLNVVINNGFAATEVVQTFFNPNNQDLEAVYSFPLPKSASLSEVTIYAGEKEIHGEVIEKDRAQQIYEDEKSNGNDTGLAEKNGYTSFDFKVYPVKANAETRIRFLYYQTLEIDTSVGRYCYPLADGGTDEAGTSFWTRNEKVENTFSMNLELKSACPVKEVRLPGFEAAAAVDRLGEGHYTASMQISDMTLTRDLVFYYRLQDGLPGRVDVIPYRDSRDKEGTFMMVITPGEDLKPLTRGSDYCFILDISGSMESKIHTLKKGMVKALGKLKPDDRFRIITFESQAKELIGKWTPVSPESLNRARTKIDRLTVGGSTNMYAGMNLALTSLDDDRAANLVIVTDAVTNTGIVEPKKFHELLRQHDVRVFGFLLGNSTNWPLMQTIADTTGGFYDTISTADDIMGKLLLAGSKIRYEALLDTRVKLAGVKTFDLTDDTFKKVYRGQQMVIFGKYEQDGSAKLTIDATLTGVDKTYETEFTFPEIDTDNPELERLWAMATIEKIEARERMGQMAASESENAVRDLGVEYQIVTGHTAMLVLSDQAFTDHGIDRRNRTRIAKEVKARANRSQQPVKTYRVDKKKKAFDFKVPDLGGGGAIDPLTGIFALLGSGFGILGLIRRKKNR